MRQLFYLLVLLVIPSQAWSFAIEGAGIANVSTASNSNVTRSYTSDGYLGVGAGALVEGKPWLALSMLDTEVGLLYYQREVGYGTLGTQTSNWLELPVLERIRFLGFSIGAGLYMARGIGSLKSQSGGGTTSYSYADANIRDFDFGWVGALSYTLPVFGLFADLRYNGGLRNLSNIINDTYKFSDVQLLVGVRF